jgi:hypothetical protein
MKGYLTCPTNRTLLDERLPDMPHKLNRLMVDWSVENMNPDMIEYGMPLVEYTLQ